MPLRAYLCYATPSEDSSDDTENSGDNDGEDGSNQTIKVASTIKKTYGSKAFSLNASAEGSLEYESSNQKVATVNSNGKVTIKGYGTAKITVTADETDEYDSATKTCTITIVPKKVSLTNAKKSGASKITATWKKDKTETG